MDKLNFKDFVAHFDPDRDDPDGYFQHRMRRRRSGVLGERTLTPDEKKKREEIAKAIERDHPDMPMSKKMAIATAAAKRVTEGLLPSINPDTQMGKISVGTDESRSLRAKMWRAKKAGNLALWNKLNAELQALAHKKAAMKEEVNLDEGKKLGLWDRIRKKRERGEPPAKPGEEGYPSKEAWKRLTKEDVQLDEISAYLADRARKKAKEDLEKEWERKPKTPEEAEKSMEKMHRRLRQHGKFLNYKPRNEDVELDEALNMAQRLKRARIMKRVHKKIEMGQKRAKRRMANMETLKRRAIKTARKFILKRLTKGIPKEELSPARKQELEKKLNTPAMKKRIQMVAMKMLKDVRKREVERHRAKQ